MSKSKVVFTLVAGVALLSGMAQGKLVSFSTDISVSTWSPSGAVVSQSISSLGPVEVTINAAAQSVFTITSTITNETGFDWTGYLLELNPAENATFVAGSAGSTKFETVHYPDLYTLEFEAPKNVLQGQVVTLQFDVSIPDGAPWSFTLTQNPIPEPATVALFGLGGVLLLLKKRRA